MFSVLVVNYICPHKLVEPLCGFAPESSGTAGLTYFRRDGYLFAQYFCGDGLYNRGNSTRICINNTWVGDVETCRKCL